MHASLLRGKQMHCVCNGTAFKKQSQEPGRIKMVLPLQMCGDNGGSKRDLTFQSFWCVWQEADEMCQ